MAAKQGKQVATDFQAAINEAREKKKNEALAAKIFGRNANQKANPPQKAQQAGGSLASRVGVKKRGGASSTTRNPPTGPRAQTNIDAHNTRTASPRPNSLASRITDPSRPPPTGPASRIKGNQRRSAQVAQALIRTELLPQSRAAHNPAPANTGFNRGLTIRGLAGPFVVMAQNFAPGTTAADIESAMTPVGGLVSSCRLLKTTPIVIAEIVFESKEGADAVIARFNNQTADGRLLHVYHKIGGASTPLPPPAQPPRAPRAERDRDDMVIDGSMGFDDPDIERGYVIDTQGSRGQNSYKNTDNNGGGLYSDRMVPDRRGRGFGGRGGGGGGGRDSRR